jgi:4-amino-4-deoxy-L-arabinose transferase-like glycosyltransferase
MISQRTLRWIWAAALSASFLLSIFAAFRGGYVGPDYMTHLLRLTDWQKIFDFSTTSPPVYYLLGHGLFKLIGSNNGFPITLSILQAALNCLAMWFFFRFIESRFKSNVVQLACAIFLTFLPVRIIHAVTIGTDSVTVPLFVLLLFLFDKLLTDKLLTEKSRIRTNAAWLGLGLSLAVATKYSFMALIPAALIIFACLWLRHHWSFNALVSICALSLIVPSGLALCSFWASSRVHGYNTEKHWLRKGIPADMNYKDLFSVKRTDAQLFQAPEYFKGQILTAHKHSYLALSHLGIFTDPMNLFQQLPVRQKIGRVLIPDQKTRPSWKNVVMTASMSLGVIWTLTALAGTARSVWHALKEANRGQLAREDAIVLLGIAYFLLMFLPIPFVYGGALFGYWTPRLILPALLSFFLAGFLLIDRKIADKHDRIAVIVLLVVTIQCALEAVMLT